MPRFRSWHSSRLELPVDAVAFSSHVVVFRGLVVLFAARRLLRVESRREDHEVAPTTIRCDVDDHDDGGSGN